MFGNVTCKLHTKRCSQSQQTNKNTKGFNVCAIIIAALNVELSIITQWRKNNQLLVAVKSVILIHWILYSTVDDMIMSSKTVMKGKHGGLCVPMFILVKIQGLGNLFLQIWGCGCGSLVVVASAGFLSAQV